MSGKTNRTDRSLWIAGIIVAAMGIAVIATVRGMFGGLGDLREGIATARREYASAEEIARRATILYLLKAQREVSMARSDLLKRPDELGQPNIALGVAKIELDHALSVAPDTTVSNRIRRLTTGVGLARGEMTIAAKIALRRLDRIHAEIDDLVQAVEPSDTTGQSILNKEGLQ